MVMILMKKLIIIGLAIGMMFMVYNKSNDAVIIPNEAIRLRVVPNSNSVRDIEMKGLVRNYLEDNVYNMLKDTETVSEARDIINSNISSIDEGIDNIFKNSNYEMNYEVKFGSNYFPDKEYKGVIYPEGNYESLVVYIGEAQGDNWWCVLFPPLCLLEAEEAEDVEYSFWVKEMIDKIF